jgi:hypothetical protein
MMMMMTMKAKRHNGGASIQPVSAAEAEDDAVDTSVIQMARI